jgi:hypothetical protein
VQFTLDAAAEEQLREVRSLLRHQIPDGDLGAIFARALGLLCAEVRKAKFAETPTPRQTPRPPKQGSRHLPAAIKRAVAERDHSRCSYLSPAGRRCHSRDFLEFHHLDPWGRSHRHSVESITLRCRPHNLHAARKDYGAEKMARTRRVPGHTAPGSPVREP